MTQEVLLTISGIHEMGSLSIETEENEALETITPAKYYLKNGKHYILYDEVMEGMPGVVKNKIKITDGKVLEIIKTGSTQSHMVFEEGKAHLTLYDTPFGQFHLDMHTRTLDIFECEDEISIKVEYALDMNHEKVADCTVFMSVKPKGAKIL